MFTSTLLYVNLNRSHKKCDIPLTMLVILTSTIFHPFICIKVWLITRIHLLPSPSLTSQLIYLFLPPFIHLMSFTTLSLYFFLSWMMDGAFKLSSCVPLCLVWIRPVECSLSFRAYLFAPMVSMGNIQWFD